MKRYFIFDSVRSVVQLFSLFLRVCFFLIIYVTIYILISYIIIQGRGYPYFLIEQLNNWTHSIISHFYLFLLVATLCKSAKASSFLPFLYQALQRPQQFVGHAAGIAVYAEDWSYVYRSGVRTVGVVAAPDLCFPYVSEYYVHSNFFCLKRNQIAIYLLPL